MKNSYSKILLIALLTHLLLIFFGPYIVMNQLDTYEKTNSSKLPINKGVELILGGTKPKSQNIKPFGIRFRKIFSLLKKDIHFNFEFSFTIKNKKI